MPEQLPRKNSVTASDSTPDIVTDLRRSLRRVRVALLIFGIPCAWSLTGLYFRSSLPTPVPRLPEMLEVIAAMAMIGFVGTILMGWTATRDALGQQNLALREHRTRLALSQLKLKTVQMRYELELRLRNQELTHCVTMRTARLKMDGFEQARLPNESNIQSPGPERNSPSTDRHQLAGSQTDAQQDFRDTPVVETEPAADTGEHH